MPADETTPTPTTTGTAGADAASLPTPPPPPAPVAGDAGSGTQAGAGVAPAAPASYTPPTAEEWAAAQAERQQAAQYRQQLQQLTPLAQAGYQAYLERQRQEREARQAKAQADQRAAAQKSWFGLPEFDPALMQFIGTDPETGKPTLLPGAPPDALVKFQQFSEAFRKTQIDFFREPQRFIADPVKEMAREEARRIVQEQFAEYQQRQQADLLVQQVLPWATATDQTGRRAYTPEGQAYVRYADQGSQLGIKDARALHDYAVGMVQRDVLLAARQQGQSPQQAQATADQFLQRAQQPRGGPATPVSPPPPPPPPGTSLEDRLRQATAGIPDDQFRLR